MKTEKNKDERKNIKQKSNEFKIIKKKISYERNVV